MIIFLVSTRSQRHDLYNAATRPKTCTQSVVARLDMPAPDRASTVHLKKPLSMVTAAAVTLWTRQAIRITPSSPPPRVPAASHLMATMGSNSSSGQIDGILNTLTYVQVVCLNFVACFFIAVGGAATFAAFAAFIAVLFGGAAAFATFIAFIAMARRLAGKMR